MLLDTHALLWFLNDDPKLSRVVRERIESADLSFVSIVSFWEIAIKVNLGKLRIDNTFHEFPELLNQLKIEILPLTFADTEQYLNLPLYHRDPFDRMLVSQAISNSLILVSRDTKLDSYPVQRFWS